MNERHRRLAYSGATGLVAAISLFSGVADLIGLEKVTENITALGYPAYFLFIIGFWKVAGGVAILLPGKPLLKEWAYAGLFFDLTGAVASHALNGDPFAKIVAPFVILLVMIASYLLRPEDRRLPGSPTWP